MIAAALMLPVILAPAAVTVPTVVKPAPIVAHHLLPLRLKMILFLLM